MRLQIKTIPHKLVAAFVVFFVGAIGVYLLTVSHAASPYVAFEAEGGTLAAPAVAQSDSATSGGKFVQFGTNSTAVLPTPTSLDSTYKAVAFDDDFSGTTLSSTKWETCVWYTKCGTAGDIADSNGGTEDAADVSVNNGLTLTATSATPSNPQSWGNGWIDSAPYYETPNGNYYVEIKAKLPPAAPGLWPALVLYEDNDKTAGQAYAEMDILERISQPQSNGTVDPPSAFQSWHPVSGSSASREIGSPGIDLTGWNTYGISVSSSGSMQYYFNNTLTGTAIAGGSNALEGMFLNLAMTTGGTPNDGWAGITTASTPSPSTMNVAYVRVFTP